MATPQRKTHFLIALIGPIFAALKRDMVDLLAGITGGAVTDPGHDHGGATSGTTLRDHIHLGALAAPGDNYVARYAAGAAIDDSVGPFAAFYPPRTVQVVAGALAPPSLEVTIDGTDSEGNALQEVILVPVPGTVQGARAFATVTRVRTNVNPLDTLDVETGNGFGVGGAVASVALVSVNGAVEAPASSHAATGTVVPTTAPNGTRVYAAAVTRQHTHPVASDTTGVTVPGVAGSPPVHMDRSERTVTAANASDLATALVLVNQLRAVYEFHRADTLAHLAADATNAIAAPVATDLGTAVTLANELKADYNAHRSQGGVHPTADTGNAIAAANASDQGTLNTLLNELKADLNLHMAAGLASASWRVVEA